MSRARALLRLAAAAAPNGTNAPTSGSVRMSVAPPTPLGGCAVELAIDTIADRVRVEVTSGRELVATLDWAGKEIGWVLRVAALAADGEQVERYLARLRDEVERAVE